MFSGTPRRRLYQRSAISLLAEVWHRINCYDMTGVITQPSTILDVLAILKGRYSSLLFRFLYHFIRVNFPGRLEAVEDLVPQPLDAPHPEAVRVVPGGY